MGCLQCGHTGGSSDPNHGSLYSKLLGAMAGTLAVGPVAGDEPVPAGDGAPDRRCSAGWWRGVRIQGPYGSAASGSSGPQLCGRKERDVPRRGGPGQRWANVSKSSAGASIRKTITGSADASTTPGGRRAPATDQPLGPTCRSGRPSRGGKKRARPWMRWTNAELSVSAANSRHRRITNSADDAPLTKRYARSSLLRSHDATLVTPRWRKSHRRGASVASTAAPSGRKVCRCVVLLSSSARSGVGTPSASEHAYARGSTAQQGRHPCRTGGRFTLARPTVGSARSAAPTKA